MLKPTMASGPEPATHLGGRRVGLPDMNPGGPGGHRDVEAVVDDQRHAGRRQQPDQTPGERRPARP